MLKDFEGLSRMIIGFSKTPEIDGEHVQIDYDLKPLDINWLRNIFNVDPNDHDFLVRRMDDKNYKINKEQYEILKPYMIGSPVNFEEYIFYLDVGGDYAEKWDWRSGYPIQIKKAATKIAPYYTNKIIAPELKSYIVEKNQETLALELGIDYWEEFYKYIHDNYPFTELSIYRINWEAVINYKRLSWEKAINSSTNVKEFLENTCLNQFKEVVIAYGPREPVIVVSLKYICNHPLENLFDSEWGACFIIGAKRDKYGIIRLVKECFIEVDCGDYLTTI
jgi:hypothetical protein